MKPIQARHQHRRPAAIREPRVLIYIDQSHNSGSIMQGVQNSGSIQQASGPGLINQASTIEAKAARLQAENERLRAQNAQYLGIMENMAERIRELREAVGSQPGAPQGEEAGAL